MCQYITLRHASLYPNLASLRKHGISPAFAQTARQVIWLHTPSQTASKVRHVAHRHHAGPEDVIVLQVRIPRKWVRRVKRGAWTCDRTIKRFTFVDLDKED